MGYQAAETKHCEESHSLLLISPCNNNIKLHSEPAAGNRSFMQDAQRATCVSLICLPFHKDMHGDSRHGVQTQHGLIFMAVKLPAGFRSVCCSPWSATAQSLHNLLALRDSTSPPSRGTALSSELLPKPTIKLNLQWFGLHILQSYKSLA